ncbi:hypothetical protein GGG16DRAFT_98701 [Schizophyllum commune]
MSLLEISWGDYTQKMWSLDKTARGHPQHLTAGYMRPVKGSERKRHPRVYVAEYGAAGSIELMPVVMKFAWNDSERTALDREYRLYAQELQPLQGRVVPNVYGYFDGRDAKNGQACSVLVMQYCSGGPVYRTDFHRPDMQAILAQILSRNVSVNELLSEDHFVLTKEGDIRVVSFASAKTVDRSATSRQRRPSNAHPYGVATTSSHHTTKDPGFGRFASPMPHGYPVYGNTGPY